MIEILRYTACKNSTLIGTFDIRVLKWGPIDIIGMKLFQKDNKKWISFPQNSVMKDGKPVYFQVIKFTDNQMMIKFMEAVMASLNAFLDPKKQSDTQPNLFDSIQNKPHCDQSNGA